MTSSGSYKSTSLKDAEREFDRLRSQAQRMYPLEKKILTECGLKPHHDLLEIGCGPGFNTPLLCELVQEGSVTSCDNDEALLNRCRSEKKGSPKRGFQTLLSTDKAIPAPNESSDFSYLRFVLQHTPARHSILSEAARILRPGGILCVLDSDDGTILQHPEDPFVTHLVTQAQETQVQRGGDRLVGRKVSGMLSELGLESVAYRVFNFTPTDIPFASLANILFGFKSDLCGQREELNRWIKETEPRVACGQYFLSAGVILTVGKKKV